MLIDILKSYLMLKSGRLNAFFQHLSNIGCSSSVRVQEEHRSYTLSRWFKCKLL